MVKIWTAHGISLNPRQGGRRVMLKFILESEPNLFSDIKIELKFHKNMNDQVNEHPDFSQYILRLETLRNQNRIKRTGSKYSQLSSFQFSLLQKA